MRFRTLHEADAARELGGIGEWEVGYCVTDGSYMVGTQDQLDAARCIPPVRITDGLSALLAQRTDKWGFAL